MIIYVFNIYQERIYGVRGTEGARATSEIKNTIVKDSYF
jgi:hypothetical protein